MDAPEKIYVHIPDDDIVGTASIQKGFPHQFVTEEYCRKDVFIEKASKWINEHTSLSEKLVIENFRKYMEGE